MLRNTPIDIAVSIGTTYTGTSIAVDKSFDGFAYQAVISAGSSPVGSIKLQASLDPSSPSNWADISDTVTAVSANAVLVWHFDKCHYSFIRCVYTRTSGSATLDTRLNENR